MKRTVLVGYTISLIRVVDTVGGFFFHKYSTLEYVCIKTSGEAPPSRIHRPTVLPPHSYAIYSNLDANPYNPKSQSSGRGKRGGRSMNSTGSLPPCSPQREKQSRKSGQRMPTYRKRGHSIDHLSLVSITKYLYGSMVSL